MMLATIALAALAADGSIEIRNDDWPVPTKDTLDTASAHLDVHAAGWEGGAEARILTNLWMSNGKRGGQRCDEAEAWIGTPWGIGPMALIDGDLGGDHVQNGFHRLIGVRECVADYDAAGVQVHPGLRIAGVQLIPYAELRWDARLTTVGLRGRVDALTTIDVRGLHLEAGIFLRTWMERERSVAQEAYHQQAGKGGFRLLAVVRHCLFTLEFAERDAQGGIGVEF